MSKKVEEIYVRLGVPDYLCTKNEYDRDDITDLPENSYKIGYEDEEGNECDEEGNYLNSNND